MEGKRIRYYISITDGWFYKGRQAMSDDDPRLVPPYSSDRVCHTSAKCWRIVESLIKNGFKVRCSRVVKARNGREWRDWG